MSWNWQLADWPNFYYEAESIAPQERQFLLNLGGASAVLKSLESSEHKRFIIEILSQEGAESSRIEGEFLNRESLQSSLKKQFGLEFKPKQIRKHEVGMAELLSDVYASFRDPLTHETLWKWHALLFKDTEIEHVGHYRTHLEPMQIISNRYDRPTIYFEAPPSAKVFTEMERFIEWFNAPHPSILGKAAVAHVYFESIHPFEDGNGRIGRVLIEKILSKGIGKAVLIAVSKVLELRKKEYYASLGSCNKSLSATMWVNFLADAILQAEANASRLLQFLIYKNTLFSSLSAQINPRQEKALLRLFEEGPEGFQGGLSAGNYSSITKATSATATRDLADLVNLGALKKTGSLRHTRYWLNFP